EKHIACAKQQTGNTEDPGEAVDAAHERHPGHETGDWHEEQDAGEGLVSHSVGHSRRDDAQNRAQTERAYHDAQRLRPALDADELLEQEWYRYLEHASHAEVGDNGKTKQRRQEGGSAQVAKRLAQACLPASALSLLRLLLGRAGHSTSLHADKEQ